MPTLRGKFTIYTMTQATPVKFSKRLAPKVNPMKALRSQFNSVLCSVDFY